MNLHNVQYIDSAGLSMFVCLLNGARKANKILIVTDLQNTAALGGQECRFCRFSEVPC